MNDRATALALRSEKEFKDLRMQVKRVLQLAFGRVPEKDEWDRLENYVEKMRKYHLKHEPEKTSYPTSITRSLVEEATSLSSTRKFYPLEHYQADKKPDEEDCKPDLQTCLVLFNANLCMSTDMKIPFYVPDLIAISSTD